MAATFVWNGQKRNATDEIILSTDKLSFWGHATTWELPIPINDYNLGTHVETNVPGDKCADPHLNNTEYVAAGTVNVNAGGTAAISATNPTEADCPLELHFNEDGTTVTITDCEFYIYDGTTPITGPVGVTMWAFEQDNQTSWVAMTGSGSVVALADHSTPANDHYYYMAVSCSPGSVGEKTAITMNWSLTYQ